MGTKSKSFALFFTLIMAISSLSLCMVQSAFAQSIPKPSVPQFTIKIIDTSYDVPTTYTIDGYTGENITHPGRHVSQNSIQFTIRNQAFTPNVDGNTLSLYYIIRTKGHFIEIDKWTIFPTLQLDKSGYISAQSGADTVLILPGGLSFPANSQIDYQVQAILGYHKIVYPYMSTFESSSSDWSPTQTLTILARADPSTPALPTPTSSPTNTITSPTPTVPEFFSWTIPLLFTIMLGIAGLLVYLKHKTRTLSPETLTKFSQGICTRSLITKTHPTMDGDNE
jgi:hypothetical protein